jgi:2,4-dichlorophenol 6-monooxygenase
MRASDGGFKDRELPSGGIVETDVLVVGSGPSGASAALALSTYGIPNIMITKYRWTANTPRAHLINQRAMEFFRDMGVEEEIKALSTPHELIGDTVFCSSIAGEEFGRIRTWGTDPQREGEYVAASPTMNCDLPQTYLEPIIVSNATKRGTETRFSSEYISHVQDADGVTTTVLDRVTGVQYQIRSKYLIGSDGARSKVAADIDLPFEGRMDVAGSMSIIFKADITEFVSHRPSVLYWVVRPGANVGGIGAGVVRMVRPWNEWLLMWGYDITQPPPEVDNAAALEIVRSLLGMPNLEAEITGTSLWSVNDMYATHLQNGRVFCTGDAIHRHPPSNGLGSNTSVQDSYNLVWKIAAVLRGWAGEALLDTYSVERAPVAKQIVLRANKSTREFGGFFDALGITTAANEGEMIAAIEERKLNTPVGRAKRKALQEALELKNYEFNTHGVEMGQFYQSTAVVSDGSVKPAPTRDPELHHTPSTVPGSPLPHAWVGTTTKKWSTLDLAPSTQFTVFTGTAGQAWADAAAVVADKLGIPLKAVVIGPGQEVTDLYFDWARLREIEEDGALLVRPDKIVAWRSPTMVDNPEAVLLNSLHKVLNVV